jgi:ABC-type uncharacterized transport system auxiliary subunit
MSRLILCGLCALTFLGSCISQSQPLEEHLYRAPLPALSGEAVPGTKPLRFDRLQSPSFLSSSMVWRVSETELASDAENSWAPHPVEELEGRLRDLLFSRLGFRESLAVGDPLLSIRILTMEGDTEDRGSARVELVADYWAVDGTQHRERFTAVEPLTRLGPDALARGMGVAIARVSDELAAWIASR